VKNFSLENEQLMEEILARQERIRALKERMEELRSSESDPLLGRTIARLKAEVETHRREEEILLGKVTRIKARLED